MRVLIYTRPKSEGFFRDIAMGVFDKPEIITFSDYNYIADIWAGKYIYDEKYDADNADFETEKDDILPRCRTLRNMDSKLAYTLARRYWNGMEEFFSDRKIDYMLTMPVDCYSLDIICRIAQRHGVNIISFVGSAIGGYAWFTLRGEIHKARLHVPEEETRGVVEKMMETRYLSPSELKNVKSNHFSIYKYHIRRTLIERLYYPLLKIRDRDPWNYHYNIYEVKYSPFRSRFDKNMDSLFRHIEDLNINPKATVYYPLHLIPEASTDYWCPLNTVDYDQYIIDMVTNSDPGIALIIKEHPAMYGRRKLSFYNKLNEFSNVILLHPMDRSNDLLQIVENVVVDNGTVGVEALMRGKRVLVLCDNYYNSFHPNAFRVKRISKESLEYPLQEYDNMEFMSRILEGCFESDFKNSTNGIPSSNRDQVIDAVREYLTINNLPGQDSST